MRQSANRGQERTQSVLEEVLINSIETILMTNPPLEICLAISTARKHEKLLRPEDNISVEHFHFDA